MGWCSHCEDDCPVIRDPDKGYICCALCGRILDQDVYFTGPSFTKDGSGQSRLTGSIMQSVQSGYSASHERTLMKGRDEISYIVSSLGVGGGDSIINKAHAFYQIAVGKNFTKGRRTTHVAAACLYIACRQTDKAYLLIDFSDYLQINVYVLGAVFLQLCKTLNLAEHPFVQKLVDPSLFIHRFTERLLGRKNNAVSETALRIVASMKRDWMQTGRKPSGLCGAAIYIAALSHGLSYTKSDVVTVVHVCEATLTKRLIEFENTESGSLTIEEFLARADELDAGSESSQLPRSGKVLCEHKDDNVTHFAHGLCEKCYTEFLKVSGGLDGGAEPPAFQRAEKQRMLKTKEEENRKESTQDTHQSDKGQESSYMQKQSSSDMAQDDVMNGSNMEREGHEPVKTSVAPEKEDLVGTTDDESERLSDIDDLEVEGYLHNEEEKKFKKIIWEEMNKEYLEEQAAKAAAAANSTTVNSVKSRKERKQKCGEDKMSDPAQTPLEATRRMLKKKGFSSRVNYEALEDLYSADQGSAKKQKVESDAADRVVEDDQTTHPRVTEDGGDETGGAYDDNNYGELSYDGYDGNGYEDYSYDDYDFS